MRPIGVMGYVLVPLLGVFMCIGPLLTRPALHSASGCHPGTEGHR